MISLCHINEIEESASRGFAVGNKYVFAVKKDGQLYVYYNYCPHLGTPLEWQEDRFLDSDNALIQCSTHGALFLIENGRCIIGPCKGKSLHPIPHVIGNGFLMIDEEYVSRLGRI